MSHSPTGEPWYSQHRHSSEVPISLPKREEDYRGRIGWFDRTIQVALAAALAANLGLHLTGIDQTFSTVEYPVAWESALTATMARSYLEPGIVSLGGLPFDNNPPLGLEPTYYLHWPPLYPILLSLLFCLFGESEAVAHSLSSSVFFALSYVTFVLGKRLGGYRTGAIAALTLLCLPVAVDYSRTVWCGLASQLAAMVSLLAFGKALCRENVNRRWAVAGSLALCAGVLTSWESVVFVPGLILGALWIRRPAAVRLSLFYGVVAGGTLLCLLGVYLWQVPYLAEDLRQTILFRMGLSEITPAQASTAHLRIYADYAGPHSFRGVTGALGGHLLAQIGVIPLMGAAGAALWLWIRRRGEGAGRIGPVAGSLVGAPLAWGLLLTSHMAIHPQQQRLTAPAVALLVGLGTARVLEFSMRWNPGWLRSATLVLLACGYPLFLLATPMDRVVSRIYSVSSGLDPLFDYALNMERSTPRGSVVLTPAADMTAVYYSRRHVIRNISDDAAIEAVLPQIRRNFPQAPIYLALTGEEITCFSRALSEYPADHAVPGFTLVHLTPDEKRLPDPH